MNDSISLVPSPDSGDKNPEHDARLNAVEYAEIMRSVHPSVRDEVAAAFERVLTQRLRRQRESSAALVRERNVWARQMADLRDEKDDALQKFSDMRSEIGAVLADRDDLSLKLEDAPGIAIRAAVEHLIRQTLPEHLAYSSRKKSWFVEGVLWSAEVLRTRADMIDEENLQ